jgi:SP family arabinose:H+ symporter-like MFS transporter
VALGGLLLGFDTAVISGATQGLTATFALGHIALGVTVSCALWGTIAGSLMAAPIGEKIGSRVALQWIAVLYAVSAIGCAQAWNWPAFLGFRLIGGFAIGGSSVLCPMYIAEIAPDKWRGRLVACFQVALVIGILLAYASNDLIAGLKLPDVAWRYDLGMAALPSLLFLPGLSFIPDSPRWLQSRGKINEARRVLERLAGDPSQLLDPETSAGSETHAVNRPQHALFTNQHKKAIWIALSLGALNQLSGINAILYYLNDIFAQAGFSAAHASAQAVLIGFANLVFTLIAFSLIDSMGRRFLLVVGSIGMAACLLAISQIFATGSHGALLLWLLITYIAFFAFSQGTVVWVYLSEIFPPGVRESGQSLGTLSVWITNGIVSAIFPLVASASGAIPFLFFSAMMIVQLFLTIFLFPETKGMSLEHASQKTH